MDILKLLHADIHYCLRDTCIREHRDRHDVVLNASDYLHPRLVDKINRLSGTQRRYLLSILGSEVSVCIAGGKRSEDRAIVNRVLAWLRVCYSRCSRCPATLDIVLYLAVVPKKFPTAGPLTAEHVNSGYAFRCTRHGLIVVYRREEWFKVFVHETMHAFCFDNAPETTPRVSSMSHGFGPPSLSEAYAESWARIVSTLERSKNWSQVRKSLDKMSEHGLEAASKVMSYVFSTSAPRTHVFSYYILTALILSDYESFAIKCHEVNGSGLIGCRLTEVDFDECIKGLRLVQRTNTDACGSLRMTPSGN